MKKKRVVILFGGKSAEHEISILSAKNVYQALDKEKYEPILVQIARSGGWKLVSGKELMLKDPLKQQGFNEKQLISSDSSIADYFREEKRVDVVFPVLHGTYGEEGSVQGFLKLLDIPFVGSGILGSAIGMDKDIQKRLLRDAGLPVTEFIVCIEKERNKLAFNEIKAKFGLPFFVKPANMGSSIGVAKIRRKKDFDTAIENAFAYDTKILIEKFVSGFEIECSVLGNENPIVSIPGEIVAQNEFYDYDAKYLDESRAVLKIPANLSEKKVKEVQHLALQTFKTLCLEGMARVDFFYTPEEKFYVNEVNTIPGFTNISMYPKLWEASGISQTKLIDRIIELAIERFEKSNRLLIDRNRILG